MVERSEQSFNGSPGAHVASASDVISHVLGLQRGKLTPMFISLTSNSNAQCCPSKLELELKLKVTSENRKRLLLVSNPYTFNQMHIR